LDSIHVSRARALAAAFTLAVALTTGGAVASGPHSPTVVAAPAVGIRVNCYSNPETTRIVNNTRSSIKIKTVGSTYQPYSYEPFWVGKTLASGASVTYQTGNAAFKNVLARTYIYNNNGDKARVTTSVGPFTKACG